ncbi:MAG: hypothetical protein EOO71_38460 [Myxococcaceae bacterium]|nr:MAG: hypothetical protein EOO71_38460 [Myxococcaceae bacterium]
MPCVTPATSEGLSSPAARAKALPTMPARAHPMKRALVVGGVASFVQGTLGKKLARWGFVVEGHQEMRSRMTAAVSAVRFDVLFIFAEMVPSRAVIEQWADAAKHSGVPCVVLDRHESHWPKALARHGYEPINPVTASAVAVTHEEAMSTTPPPPRSTPTPRPPGQPFEDLMTQLEVLLTEMKDAGLETLSWSRGKGLDYEAVIRTRGHRAV